MFTTKDSSEGNCRELTTGSSSYPRSIVTPPVTVVRQDYSHLVDPFKRRQVKSTHHKKVTVFFSYIFYEFGKGCELSIPSSEETRVSNKNEESFTVTNL